MVRVKEIFVHRSIQPDDAVVGAKIDYYKIRAIPASFVTHDGTWQDKLYGSRRCTFYEILILHIRRN